MISGDKVKQKIVVTQVQNGRSRMIYDGFFELSKHAYGDEIKYEESNDINVILEIREKVLKIKRMSHDLETILFFKSGMKTKGKLVSAHGDMPIDIYTHSYIYEPRLLLTCTYEVLSSETSERLTLCIDFKGGKQYESN